MAQTYTLEEAADKLNLSIEEFKRRLRTEWTQIRSFRDGATLRFRANEIDELARTYGLGSSDEMPLAESSPLESSPLDIPDDIGLAPKAKAKGDSGAPLNLDDSSEEAFALAPDAPGSSKSKKKGDSDARLEASSGKQKTASADDEESILTEELELPSAGGSSKLSGKSGKLSSARLKSGESGKQKTGSSGKQRKPAPPPADDSSEFELTLDADSDEFELSLTQDSSDEVALGAMPASTPAGKSGQSGINLNRPADSGVSLENKKKGDDDEIDFELSLDAPGTGMSSRKNLAGSGSKTGSKSGSRSGAGSGKSAKTDSDSEFELSLEEPSDSGLDLTPAAEEKKGDIFEATDFEIPALDDDSASEAVSLDDSDTDVESSDFDLALDDADADADDESASQVVALDDDDAPKSRKKKRRTDDDDDDDVDLDGVGGALRGVRDEDEEEDRAAMVAAPAEWGPWPAVMMFPTLIVLFIGTIMAYEVLHSMWGYQQGSQPGTPLVNFMAEKFDMKPAQ
jgi:hypothetical protein